MVTEPSIDDEMESGSIAVIRKSFIRVDELHSVTICQEVKGHSIDLLVITALDGMV